MNKIRHHIVEGEKRFTVEKMRFTNVARNVYSVAVGDYCLRMSTFHFRDLGIGTPRRYYCSNAKGYDVPPLIAERIDKTIEGVEKPFNTYTAPYVYCCGTRVPRTIHIIDRYTEKTVELLYSDWSLQTLSIRR